MYLYNPYYGIMYQEGRPACQPTYYRFRIDIDEARRHHKRRLETDSSLDAPRRTARTRHHMRATAHTANPMPHIRLENGVGWANCISWRVERTRTAIGDTQGRYKYVPCDRHDRTNVFRHCETRLILRLGSTLGRETPRACWAMHTLTQMVLPSSQSFAGRPFADL